MATSRINHVSVSATDLAASTEFYMRLLGVERIPTPDFGVEVQWLACGDTQLHLFSSDLEPTRLHHFGVEVDVDRLAAAYRMAKEEGILESEAFGHHLIELPGDVAQMYLRDPSGNLIELDAPGASALPEDMRADIRVLAEMRPQEGERAAARLYVGADRRAVESV